MNYSLPGAYPRSSSGTGRRGIAEGGGTDPRKTTALRCHPFTWCFPLTFLPALARKPYKSRDFVVSTIPLLINWS
jgi:hypothetical protein